VFVLDVGEETTEAGPVVGESSGAFEAFQSNSDEQIVRIRHISGDSIPTAELEVVVDASDACGKRGRIATLPLGSVGASNTISAGNVEGDDIFDNGFGAVNHGALDEETFGAGSVIRFRIAKGDCSVARDEALVVRIIHTPTNSVVISEQLTAT
jgi:FlaG/FlaF family flagellin (archaellin)